MCSNFCQRFKVELPHHIFADMVLGLSQAFKTFLVLHKLVDGPFKTFLALHKLVDGAFKTFLVLHKRFDGAFKPFFRPAVSAT